MTTPDEEPDHDEVRDLLGELGASLRASQQADDDTGPGTGPIPPQVSARIEAALAQQPPVEVHEETTADVVPLRRRRLAPWLAAAAAVAVIVGGTYALARSTSSNDTASSASAAAGSAPSTVPHAPSSTPLPTPLSTRGPNGSRAALPSLTTADFASQVGDLLDHPATASLDGLSAQSGSQGLRPTPSGATADRSTPDSYSQKVPEGTAPRSPVPDCTRPAGVPGRQVEVSLDGRLAQLIVTRVDGHRLVRAYDCGGRQVLATTTLP